ncbi:MAG TPA: TonB-dependent receptor, partial [Bacteroidia bacterium]|nr:TonB-dependent receptor [Bacteroidia bacterium]
LDDSEFNADPRLSERSRNWLTTPWNIIALTSNYKVSDRVSFTLRSALNLSARDIVWRNEDGGPEAVDSVNTPREVEHEGFKSSTTEIRMLAGYTLGGKKQVLAAGVRIFSGDMDRDEGGPGSAGSDLDLKLYGGDYDKQLRFQTFNIAPFAENIFHIGNHLSVTPGIRYEYLRSSATGYVTDDSGSILSVNTSKPRYIVLAGIGLQFSTSATTNLYGNISQAYRPIEYSFQYPFGLDANAKIDPDLKDISGYNADAGWRGTIKRYLNFDVGVFYLKKKNEIAMETLLDSASNPYLYETNVADAVHKGVETYVEVNISKLFNPHAVSSLSLFNSFAYDDARYINGLYKGNQAAYAPAAIERVGLTYTIKAFSATFLFSSTSKCYSDANNTVFSPDAETGIIPAYQVMDFSASYKIKNYKIKFGIDNLA